MTRISSSPIRPAIAGMRIVGGDNDARPVIAGHFRRNVLSARTMLSSIRSTVRRSGTSFMATWLVTRPFHMPFATLNSLTRCLEIWKKFAAQGPVRRQNHCRPRCMDSLLNGMKMMPSAIPIWRDLFQLELHGEALRWRTLTAFGRETLCHRHVANAVDRKIEMQDISSSANAISSSGGADAGRFRSPRPCCSSPARKNFRRPDDMTRLRGIARTSSWESKPYDQVPVRSRPDRPE